MLFVADHDAPHVEKAFRPNCPWPTVDQRTRRVLWAVALIGMAQFFVDALAPYFARGVLLGVRLAAGTLVGLATMRIERFFARQRRLGR